MVSRIVLSVLLTATFSSCLKKFDCACHYQWYDNNKVTEETDVFELEASGRKSARDACRAGSENSVVNGNGYISQCDLQ